MTNAPRVLVFDVNQTLLDLAPVQQSVGAALGGRSDLVPLWFTTLLQYSMVETMSGAYRDVAEIGVGTLMMLGEQQGLEIDRATAEAAVLEPMRHLPAHPDVEPALEEFGTAGLEIVALTNSSTAGVDAQLTNAGIIGRFDHVLSTEAVQAFKPDPRPYRHALDVVGAAPGEALMVAAHPWDLMGAQRVGLRTAFVARPGAVLHPDAERPDHVVADLSELVTALAG